MLDFHGTVASGTASVCMVFCGQLGAQYSTPLAVNAKFEGRNCACGALEAHAVSIRDVAQVRSEPTSAGDSTVVLRPLHGLNSRMGGHRFEGGDV
jgi:hypothetical protein